MYLKEIEIQGFKSFADKTKVVFDKGVTAVVGPNGSGKSNITESLRWALGESSVKSLRGGKMPDVIFAGTESRKPLNYACVTVVLDNQDGFIQQAGKEIRVERHIYRSGDSEYKIDGKKVRLRDVHDLFMDTGLGRDSFSIISQGRVEEIFNSKPEERRAIFEEAAGVLKFKTRRKETETKLNQTQENLDRLEDILYELEGQIQPLEKQATVARRFLELDQERQVLLLDVLVAQVDLTKDLYEKADQEEKVIQEQLASYYQRRQVLEEDNVRIKKARHQLDESLAEDQASLLEVTRLISDLEKQIEVAKLQSSQAAHSRRENLERLDAVLARLEEAKQELAQKQETLAVLQQRLTENRQQQEELEKELANYEEDPEQVIEHLREQYVALLQTEAEKSNERTAIESRIQALLQESSHRQEDLTKAQTNFETAKEKEVRQLEELEQAQATVKGLLAEYQEQLVKVEQAKAAYQEAQAAMFDLMDESKNKRARINSLEAIQKNHSNFYAGVKSVLQEAERLGGICGAVSENLSFSKDYQTALEIALGASSQQIIVEDEKAATRAIDFLKRNRLGRATFLPLTTIKARQLSPRNLELIQASAGFLGIASDLVTYEHRFEQIFQNLLGVTAIFDTTEHAREAARKVNYQVRMVTLDGTELRTGGSYAGGANRSQNTVFVKPELDSLKQEMQALDARLREAEQEVETKDNLLKQAQEYLASIQSQGEQARLEQQRAQLAYQQSQEQLKEIQELLEALKSELATDATQSLQEELESLTEQLAEIELQKENLNRDIETMKSDKDVLQQKVQNLQEQLAALRLQQTEYKSQQSYEQTDARRLEETISQLEVEEHQLQLLIEQGEAQVQTVDVEQLANQLAQAQAKKTDLEQGVIRKRFELDDLEGQAEDVAEQMEQARKKNEEWIRQQAKAEATREKHADRLNKLLTQITDEFMQSFDQAKEQAKPVENLAAAENQLKSIEKDIKALGPVNVDAIGQYDEVKGRFDFLSSQREDVLAAKNMLLSTINDMNDEVKERFKSTFEAIRESFKVTFRQMFGGGSADLILTEPDLLTAGVEISVQPPGKKIQSLNLMSGGEKALSALALLFSIIRVKTIPFVILDEVEAALDEANVKRFGDYLNRFDKESQFIVVTHRKGTMSAADSIYGVTMQESGVSKIVSVKLKDLENEE